MGLLCYMINEYVVKKYCNESLSLIENYDKAIADKEQTWDCHHRREIETSRKELIELGEYYNRSASELIFLTKKEHISLHHKDKNMSEETKRKMSEAIKHLNWFNNGITTIRAKSCPEGFVKGRLKKAI